MSITGTESEERKIWWKLTLAGGLSTPRQTSLECRFANATKMEQLVGNDVGQDWHESIFKPETLFKIICPNNEVKIIESLEHFRHHGDQVEHYTISTPEDMKNATFTIRYVGKPVNIVCEVQYKQRLCTIDFPRGDESCDDSGFFSPDGSTSFSRGTPRSSTPLPHEATPRGRPRATSSPPIRPDFGEPKPSE